MFHFYNPLKRQKTKAFVTFSGDKTQVKITRLFILRRGITREHLHTCATSSGAKKINYFFAEVRNSYPIKKHQSCK